jgi:hypothetical protein
MQRPCPALTAARARRACHALQPCRVDAPVCTRLPQLPLLPALLPLLLVARVRAAVVAAPRTRGRGSLLCPVARRAAMYCLARLYRWAPRSLRYCHV